MSTPNSDQALSLQQHSLAPNGATGVGGDASVWDPTIVSPIQPRSCVGGTLTRLGPYVVEQEIGRGAMGIVLRATHSKLKRNVALKVLPDVSTLRPERLLRFQREMEAVGRLDHPHIVRATDAGEYEGIHFLAMELLDGTDLQKLLAQVERFDVGTACEAIRQAALGLQHVHDNQLVHRDIKPSNLVLTRDGLIKILDLGVAMLRPQGATDDPQTTGGILGTPDFMAPEQINRSQTDIRADVYSLGCTLYTLLSGRAPFHGSEYETHTAKLLAHSQTAPPPLRSLVPGIPHGLVKIVQQMMAKQPVDRHQTPREVADALTTWADASALAQLAAEVSATADKSDAGCCTVPAAKDKTRRDCAQPTVPRISTSQKRRRMVLGAAICAGTMAVLAVAIGTQMPRDRHSGDPAAANSDKSRVSAPSPGRDSAADESVPSDVGTIGKESETNLAITESLREVAENTSQIRDTSRELAHTGQAISRQTERIAGTLETLRDNFQAAQHGGLIADPKSAGEFYHNARLCQRQGNYTLAREFYLQLFQSGAEFTDVHHEFQQFLKLQEGLAGAREVYRSLPGDSASPVRTCAVALLEAPEQRERQLTALVESNPNFAPALYELSRCASQIVLGQQSLADKAKEKELVERFLALHEQGQLLRYFLDQSEAAHMIDDAHQRLNALSALDHAVFERPVTLSFSRHRAGWNLIFHVAEATRELRYRLSPTDEFRSTGFTDKTDPQTGHPAPKTFAVVPRDTPRCDVEIKYTDVRGMERGPYSAPFDPSSEAVRDAKRKLNATKNSWGSFGRHQDRDRLYFTHLSAYSDAIAELRYAVDEDTPATVHELPPLAGTDGHRFYVQVSPSATYAVIQLTFRDGTQSEVVRVDRPPN